MTFKSPPPIYPKRAVGLVFLSWKMTSSVSFESEKCISQQNYTSSHVERKRLMIPLAWLKLAIRLLIIFSRFLRAWKTTYSLGPSWFQFILIVLKVLHSLNKIKWFLAIFHFSHKNHRMILNAFVQKLNQTWLFSS